MTLHKHVNGDVIDAPETNQDNAEGYTLGGLNLIRSLIDRAAVWSAGMIDWWGDAYIDANGRENSVDTGDSLAIFNTDKYETVPVETVYAIIEANDATISWTNNDCFLQKVSSGKWLLTCDTGSDAVKRAQIIQSLFYGTNGTDALIDDFTSVTALKITDSDLVGYRGVLRKFNGVSSNTAAQTVQVTDTFTDTSNNISFRMWGKITKNGYSSSANDQHRLECPSGTNILSLPGNTVSLEIDDLGLTGTTPSNPATMQFDNYTGAGWSRTFTMMSFYVCKGAVTQGTPTIGTGCSVSTDTLVDYYADNSIPLFTLAGDYEAEEIYSTIEHDIPTGTFGTTITNAIGVPLIEDWEDGANIQYKLTGSAGAEDTGWLDAMDTEPEGSSFTAFTAEPDTLIVKLVPKTTSPTAGYPSIKGFVMRST